MSLNLSFTLLTLVLTLDITWTQLINLTSTLANLPEEAQMNFTELAAKSDLAALEHTVVTDDGYVLTLFHIPGNKKRPVLLAHGVFGTADIFIARGRTSLAYILAKEGYDVWALNVRGTRYSRRHVRLDPDKDKAFWDFSIQEHGYYDLSSIIDYILNATGQSQLSIIGISEGTTITFVLGSTRPEYNEKVKVFIALAPIVYLHNIGLPTSIMIQFSSEINDLLIALGLEELFGYQSIFKAMYNVVCSQKIGYDLCLKLGVFSITGADSAEIEPEFFRETVGQFPDGTSRKNMAHYAQISKRKIFAKYNYGKKNIDVYGTDSPPNYDLNKVVMDVVLICGKNDKLSTLKDVQILRKELPNVIAYRIMKPVKFNHLDHVWGRHVHKISYPFILQTLKKYN